jgi:hypothetical protein
MGRSVGRDMWPTGLLCSSTPQQGHHRSVALTGSLATQDMQRRHCQELGTEDSRVPGRRRDGVTFASQIGYHVRESGHVGAGEFSYQTGELTIVELPCGLRVDRV